MDTWAGGQAGTFGRLAGLSGRLGQARLTQLFCCMYVLECLFMMANTVQLSSTSLGGFLARGRAAMLRTE